MSFLPPDFEPPLLETERFRLRSLTVHDVVKDYDAVMTSREHLWELFGEAWGWPPADSTETSHRADPTHRTSPPGGSRTHSSGLADPTPKTSHPRALLTESLADPTPKTSHPGGVARAE